MDKSQALHYMPNLFMVAIAFTVPPSFLIHEVILGSPDTTRNVLQQLQPDELIGAWSECAPIVGGVEAVIPDNKDAEIVRQHLDTLVAASAKDALAWSKMRTAALKRNVERFGGITAIPFASFPHADAYVAILPILHALKSYVVAESPDEITLPQREFSSVTAALCRIDRNIIQAFGPDMDKWPTNLRHPLEELHQIAANILEKLRIAASSLEEILVEMEKNGPEGKVRSIAIRGLSAIKAVFGTLSPEHEALLFKKGTRAELALLQKWGAQSARVEALYEKSLQEFELTSGMLENLLEIRDQKIPLWKTGALSIQSAAQDFKQGVPEREWTRDMEDLYHFILSEAQHCIQASDAFLVSHGTLLQATQDIRELYSAAMHHKVRAGSTLGKARQALMGYTEEGINDPDKKEPHNLTDLVGNRHAAATKTFVVSDREFKYKGHTISFKEGKVEMDGKPLDVHLNMGQAAQEAKIKMIADLLDIPENEISHTLRLTPPFYQAEVTRRLERGEPLRELLGVDENFGVAKIYDYRFGTAFYVPYHFGWHMARGARAVMPLFHGGGGARSRGETLLAAAGKLRHQFEVNPLVFDLPNHGSADTNEMFLELTPMMVWMTSIIEYCRFLSNKEIPIIALGRSLGEAMLDEFAAKNPAMLDGIVGVSGYRPGWLAANEAAFIERIASGDFEPHPTGFPMALAYDGLHWNGSGFEASPRHSTQWTFDQPDARQQRKKTPKLMFTGTEDQDSKRGVPDFVEQRRAIAADLGHQGIIFEGAQHDLLALNLHTDSSDANRERITRAYQAIGAFIESTRLTFNQR